MIRKKPARCGLRVWAAALSTVLVVTAVSAQQPDAFPSRPVRLVVPFPPGGGSDMQARLLADKLRQVWTQPVVVENIAGAGGGVASSAVARAKPDGHTILFATHPMIAINPLLYKKLPYEAKDFTPVVKLMDAPLVLLVPSGSPFRTLPGLIKAAKEKPGAINYGSGGLGTTQHLTGEMLKVKAGIDLTLIPYKGNAQTNTALIANEIQLFFDSAPSAAARAQGWPCARDRGDGPQAPGTAAERCHGRGNPARIRVVARLWLARAGRHARVHRSDDQSRREPRTAICGVWRTAQERRHHGGRGNARTIRGLPEPGTRALE